MLEQTMCDIHGSVAPSGASNRDGQAAAFVGVERQQEIDQTEEALQERSRIWVGGDVRAYGRVLAGQRFELGLVVRVAQKAHVKEQIDVGRKAVLESEGQDLDAQPSAQ